jgi:hypothetical protein
MFQKRGLTNVVMLVLLDVRINNPRASRLRRLEDSSHPAEFQEKGKLPTAREFPFVWDVVVNPHQPPIQITP